MSVAVRRVPLDIATGWRVAAVLAMVAAALQTANALLFGWHAGIPLPVSDAWYFLEGFVGKAMTDGLTVRDFFDQRSAGDHAQPFQKLVLLAHLRVAGLDFRVEEMVGLVGAVVSALLLSFLAWRSARMPAQRAQAVVAAASFWVVVFSTNATELYTWSLVSLGWWMVASAIGFWWLSSRVEGHRAGGLLGLLGAGLLGLAWDEVAIPIAVAAIAARVVLDRGPGLNRTLLFAAASATGIALARLLLVRFGGDAAAEATGGSLPRLLAIFHHPDAWHAITGPLADSVVHRSHLDAWAGTAAGAWQFAIAAVLCVGHYAFWRRVWRARQLPARSVAITAVAMMLFFYACVAGILLSRGVDFGPLYVHQPRYVLVYQLNLIALGLLLLAPPEDEGGVDSRRSAASVGALVALLAVVAVQYPLARAGWAHAAYLRDYVQRSALIIGQLAADAGALPPAGCSQILTICSAPPETRRKVMRMLVDHRLSVFSPAFQARHGLYPDAGTAAVAAGAPACSASLLDWGPRRIVRGQGFNVQEGGRSAFWVRLAPRAQLSQLTESGQKLDFVRGDGVISFQVDQGLADKIASRPRLDFELSCPQGGSARFRVPIVQPGP